MGLDSVELLLAIEEEFQITLTDDEAFKSETPNLLTDKVYSKLRKSRQEVCPSIHGFFVVRKILIEQLEISREKIKPETMLDEVINEKSRKKIWKNLLFSISKGQNIYAPLEKSSWMKVLITGSIMLTFILIMIETGDIVLSLIPSCIIGIILNFVILPFQSKFPRNYQTIKDLIRVVSTLDTKIWSRDEVYHRVKKVVTEQLDVKEEDVQPNSHFVNDLGMG
jgi:acyl carrier protein